VGTVSETIKVSARSVILNTDDATLGNRGGAEVGSSELPTS
jgi:hypothetical protein